MTAYILLPQLACAICFVPAGTAPVAQRNIDAVVAAVAYCSQRLLLPQCKLHQADVGAVPELLWRPCCDTPNVSGAVAPAAWQQAPHFALVDTRRTAVRIPNGVDHRSFPFVYTSRVSDRVNASVVELPPRSMQSTMEMRAQKQQQAKCLQVHVKPRCVAAAVTH